MKVKVIRNFRDKYSKEAIRAGRELEVTLERFGELTAGPFAFVEEVQEEANEKTQEEKVKEVQEIPLLEKETDTEEKEQPPTDESTSKEEKKNKSTKK